MPAQRPPAPNPRQEAAERQAYQNAVHARARQAEWNRRKDLAKQHGYAAEQAQIQANKAWHYANTAPNPQLRYAWQQEATRQQQIANHHASEVNKAAAATPPPARHTVPDTEWRGLNHDPGNLARGPVTTGTASRRPGPQPAPSDQSRPYGRRGGLRPPLALHQRDLENAMPRDANGDIVLNPAPSEAPGSWFTLQNDGGPMADPTRGQNCLDCSLSFLETWGHGRPRVAAPRTFDGYSNGDPQRVADGEWGGTRRAEAVTGGQFQLMTPPHYNGSGFAQVTPQQLGQAVDRAFLDLRDALLAKGPGSSALIVTSDINGGSHAWVAINQGGQVLFVDPQIGMVRPYPMHSFTGQPGQSNVHSVEALFLDSDARPSPTPNRQVGYWTSHEMPPPAPQLVAQQTPPIQTPPAQTQPVQTQPVQNEQVTSQQTATPPVTQPITTTPPVDTAQDTATTPTADTTPTQPITTTPDTDATPRTDATPETSATPDPRADVTRPVSTTPEADATTDLSDGTRLSSNAADPSTQAPSTTYPRDTTNPATTAPQPTTGPDPQVSSPQATPAPQQQPDPRIAEEAQRKAYEDSLRERFRAVEHNRRLENAKRVIHKRDIARTSLAQAERSAAQEDARGNRVAADYWRNEAVKHRGWVAHWQREVDAAMAVTPSAHFELTDRRAWRDANTDTGLLADGPVESGTISGRTGSGHPTPIDQTRRYDERGGHRRPLALHQRDLERAMPRNPDGSVMLNPPPSTDPDNWFQRMNDGGPSADPTRGQNCVDCSLSFLETWGHGRPRVSAPRTFDGYSNGDPLRFALNGEADGYNRVQTATGGQLQNLSPVYLANTPPQQVKSGVDNAYYALEYQLQAGGHGSYALILNGWEGGGGHAHVAINQNGTILYLDPQTGAVSTTPLYPHSGTPNAGNPSYIEAVILDGNTNPNPLPNFPPGHWTSAQPAPQVQPVTTPPQPPATPIFTPNSQQVTFAGAPGGPTGPSDPPPPRTGGPDPGGQDPEDHDRQTHREDGAETAPASIASPVAEASSDTDARSEKDADAETDSDQSDDDTAPGPELTPEQLEARDVLVDLPRVELTDHFPLPTLDTPEFPVRRDSNNLIAEVQVNGAWVHIDSYVDQLSAERARIWRRCRIASLSRSDLKEFKRKHPDSVDLIPDGVDYPPFPSGVAEPCTAVAIDRLTGQITEGHNNLDLLPGDLHPLVQARVDQYLERCRDEITELPKWGAYRLHPSEPGTHCEVTAVSELLWRRQAAGIPVSEDSFAELIVDNDFPFSNKHKEAPCCANCTGIIPDVPCISGKFETYPPDEKRKRPR